MAFLDKMKDTISVAGQGVQQKAKTATESVRIGNLIKNNERMIEKITYQVGALYVKNHLDDVDSEYAEMFQEIKRLQMENQGYQEELQRLTAVNVCPQCGFGNNTSAKFCISCGAPMASEPSAPVNGKKCPQCGAVNEADAVFCTECGTKLPEKAEEALEEAVAEPEPDPNVCRNCGAVLAEDSLFCTECGTKRE